MNGHRSTRIFSGLAAAAFVSALAQPAFGQLTATPAYPPLVHTDPNQSQAGLFCPKTAKASGDEPAPSGWSIYAGSFAMPLWSVAVMSESATSDRLLCIYGGQVQLSLSRIVPKGTCTANPTKTGFSCK